MKRLSVVLICLCLLLNSHAFVFADEVNSTYENISDTDGVEAPIEDIQTPDVAETPIEDIQTPENAEASSDDPQTIDNEASAFLFSEDSTEETENAQENETGFMEEAAVKYDLTLELEKQVVVSGKGEKTARFVPKTSGEYIFMGYYDEFAMAVELRDSDGQTLLSKYDNQIFIKYQLEAGKTYYYVFIDDSGNQYNMKTVVKKIIPLTLDKRETIASGQDERHVVSIIPETTGTYTLHLPDNLFFLQIYDADFNFLTYYYHFDKEVLSFDYNFTGGKKYYYLLEFNGSADQYTAYVEKAGSIPATGVKLKTSLEIAAGQSAELIATVSPTNATNKKVQWKSSKPSVVSVDEYGKITAKSRGLATISATTVSGNFTAKCSVRVLFSDVTNKKLAAYDAIYWGADKGYVNGYGSYFDINGKCTRAQFVLFLWRAAGKPLAKATTLKFKDASDIEKLAPDYKKAILWGSEKGIVAGFTSGKNEGKFLPNDPCTRGQVVTFLWRYGGQKAAKAGAKTFPDVPKTHKYYKAIMWASSYGITTGFGDGKFKPDDTCTRGQCVTFLYRMLK